MLKSELAEKVEESQAQMHLMQQAKSNVPDTIVLASEDEDDNSVGQGSSRSFSTASMSLDNILTKIENCKATLMDDDISVDQQVAAAELIEKLSKAALAVKNLEDMDV